MVNAGVEFQWGETDITEWEVCRTNWPGRIHRDALMNGWLVFNHKSSKTAQWEKAVWIRPQICNGVVVWLGTTGLRQVYLLTLLESRFRRDLCFSCSQQLNKTARCGHFLSTVLKQLLFFIKYKNEWKFIIGKNKNRSRMFSPAGSTPHDG